MGYCLNRLDDIPVHYYDGLKFACMDFSSKQQKRRKALCIQTDLFLSFLITQLSFLINGWVCLRNCLKRSSFVWQPANLSPRLRQRIIFTANLYSINTLWWIYTGSNWYHYTVVQLVWLCTDSEHTPQALRVWILEFIRIEILFSGHLIHFCKTRETELLDNPFPRFT